MRFRVALLALLFSASVALGHPGNWHGGPSSTNLAVSLPTTLNTTLLSSVPMSLEFERTFAYYALESATGDDVFDFGFPAAGGEFSLAVWAKSSGNATISGTLMSFGSVSGSPPSNRFMVQNHSGQGFMFIDIEMVGATGIKRYRTANASTPISSSPAWFHTVVTFDGLNLTESLKIYIDGAVEVTTKTVNQNIENITNLDMFAAIGGFKQVGGSGFQPAHHFIFNTAAWDTELSAAEITAIFALGDGLFDLRVNSGGYVSAANLQVYVLVGNEADPNLGRNLGLSGIDISFAKEIDAVDPNLHRSEDIPTAL